jgi:hypothetical protein
VGRGGKVPKRKLEDLLKSATSNMCLGWLVCDFPQAFGKFLKYIVEKYSVDLNVEVEYKDSERFIYVVIPVSAFKVKPPMELRRSAEATANALRLFVPLDEQVEWKPGLIYSTLAWAIAIRLPAGAFERKVVDNRDCYAKYLDANNIVVACR